MRHVTIAAMIAGLLMTLIGALSAEDWPRFLGPNADGISREKGINKDWKGKPPKVLWRVPMSDRGFAGPSVADGKVFIIDHKGDKDIVRAIDIKTGKDVWTFTYADSPKANYGYARATPLIEDDKVYVSSRFVKVHCLNAKSGEKIWGRDLKADYGVKLPAWEYASSPVLDGDRLLTCPGGAQNAGLIALDKKTGKTLLQGGGSEKGSYATPVVAEINGKKQYLIFTAAGLRGVNSEDGKVLWAFPWKTGHDVNASTPIAIDDNKVFINSGYGHGCALVQIKGDKVAKLWENKNMHSHFSTPVFFKGHIYGNSDRNRLVCIDPRDGQLKWEQRGFEKGGVVAVDEVLIAMNGSSGELIMVDLNPQAYKELGRIQPFQRRMNRSWTAPIIADGKLIARNRAELVCIELK